MVHRSLQRLAIVVVTYVAMAQTDVRDPVDMSLSNVRAESNANVRIVSNKAQLSANDYIAMAAPLFAHADDTPMPMPFNQFEKTSTTAPLFAPMEEQSAQSPLELHNFLTIPEESTTDESVQMRDRPGVSSMSSWLTIGVPIAVVSSALIVVIVLASLKRRKYQKTMQELDSPSLSSPQNMDDTSFSSFQEVKVCFL
jgi:hypothetical protein